MNKLKHVFINILRLCRFQTQVHRAPENIPRGGWLPIGHLTVCGDKGSLGFVNDHR